MIRIGTANLPFGTRRGKARLLRPTRRTPAAIRIFNLLALRAISLQEASSFTKARFRLRKNWGIVSTSNNFGLPILGNPGNAVVWRKDYVRKVHSWKVKLDWGRLGLRIPFVYLEVRENLFAWIQASVHLPAGSSGRAAVARRKMIGRLAAEAESARGLYGLPVVLAGDFNTVVVGAILEKREADWHFKHNGIDWIAWLGDIEPGSFGSMHSGWFGEIADHPLVHMAINKKEV